MVLKHLSVREISRLSRVPYSTCSSLLSGRLIQPDYLAAMQAAAEKAPEVLS